MSRRKRTYVYICAAIIVLLGSGALATLNSGARSEKSKWAAPMPQAAKLGNGWVQTQPTKSTRIVPHSSKHPAACQYGQLTSYVGPTITHAQYGNSSTPAGLGVTMLTSTDSKSLWEVWQHEKDCVSSTETTTNPVATQVLLPLPGAQAGFGEWWVVTAPSGLRLSVLYTTEVHDVIVQFAYVGVNNLAIAQTVIHQALASIAKTIDNDGVS